MTVRTISVLFGVAFLVGAPLAFAADPPPPSPPSSVSTLLLRADSESLGSFESAFTWLAAQTQATFVAEASPRDPIMPKSVLKSLLASLPNDGLPADEMIRRIATAYDYDVAPDTSGKLYILTKRYTSPDDLPFVTLDEAIHAFTNISRCADRLNPHAPLGGPDAPLMRFARSLSPEQQKQMGSGLPVSALSKEQQQALWDWNLQTYVQKPIDIVDKMVVHWKIAKTRRPVYRWMNLFGTDIRAFGFEGPFDGPQTISQFGLSHRIEAQPLNGCNLISTQTTAPMVVTRLTDPITTRDKALSDKIVADFQRAVAAEQYPDPNAPRARDAAPPATPPASCHPLSDLIQRLNAENRPHFHADVEDDLATKPITVIGPMDALPPRQILDAAAQVYGLRVLEHTDGTTSLTVNTPPVARDYVSLGAALRQSFPAPWRRAYFGGEQREVQEIQEAERREAEMPAALAAIAARLLPTNVDPHRIANQPQHSPGEAFLRSKMSLYYAAERRLRAIVEPQVAAAPDGRFPMGDANDEAKRLLALIYVANYIPELQGWLAQSEPLCLSDFQDTVIVGSSNLAQGTFTIALKTDTNGTWHIENNISSSRNSLHADTETPSPASAVPGN